MDRNAAHPGAAAVAPARRMEQLGRDEALRLLATVSLGRIVFTQYALPAVRPVNHLVEGESIIVRVHEGEARSPPSSHRRRPQGSWSPTRPTSSTPTRISVGASW